MDEQKVQKVMDMASCSEDDAKKCLEKTNGDVFEAICLSMNAIEVEKTLDETQKFFKETRKSLAEVERLCKKRLAISDQSELSELDEKKNHREEKVQQNNCSNECHPLTLEQEVEIPAIVCPLLSECSCDSQLNNHT